MLPHEARALLSRLFKEAITAVEPSRTIPRHLPGLPHGRTIVVGAGKASAAMARAVEDGWRAPLSGLVVTRVGHAVPCERIEIVEAPHPIPGARGENAARRILELAKGAGPDDLVLCLMSGGGSALIALPDQGLTLADKQTVSRALLKSGATIREINVVRKHLSAIKAGRLAAAAFPARVVTLLVSDVPGDDPAVIASGPTVADDSTSVEALEILQRYAIEAPPSVVQHLLEPRSETLKPGNPLLARSEVVMVGTPMAGVQAAARAASALGLAPCILGDAIEGEARELGRAMAGIALSVRRHGLPVQPPAVLLSGGETTVTVRGRGRGGRNTEFLLGLALALDGASEVFALAADTDGIDGSEDNAGAFVLPDTLARARALGRNLQQIAAANDSYSLFEVLDDLFVTGPTRTNINDFRAVIIA